MAGRASAPAGSQRQDGEAQTRVSGRMVRRETSMRGLLAAPGSRGVIGIRAVVVCAESV